MGLWGKGAGGRRARWAKGEAKGELGCHTAWAGGRKGIFQILAREKIGGFSYFAKMIREEKGKGTFPFI